MEMNNFRLIKFIFQKNTENLFKLIVYALIVGLFTYFYGISLSGINYDNAARKLLKNAEDMYLFIPYIGVDTISVDDEQIVLDSGIFVADDYFGEKNEKLLYCSPEFYEHMNLNLKTGTIFSSDENEVIAFASSNYKVGDYVNVIGPEIHLAVKWLGLLTMTYFFRIYVG